MAAFGGWRLTRTGILFVIGIIVLGGLVTGGVFLIKNHGEAVRRDQAVKVAEQNLKDKSTVATQPVNTPSTDGGNQTSTTATNTTANSTTTTTSTATELPVTGFDGLQAFGRTIIVAILAFSVASFVSSRRAANHL